LGLENAAKEEERKSKFLGNIKVGKKGDRETLNCSQCEVVKATPRT